jgi:hypothetical protein
MYMLNGNHHYLYCCEIYQRPLTFKCTCMLFVIKILDKIFCWHMFLKILFIDVISLFLNNFILEIKKMVVGNTKAVFHIYLLYFLMLKLNKFHFLYNLYRIFLKWHKNETIVNGAFYLCFTNCATLNS